MINYNERELKKINKIASKILERQKIYKEYTKDEIKNIVSQWKKENIDIDQILIDAFAICREITKRVLGKSQYKVQLVGGIVLTQGRIAEMKTGEGKTLTELCPAFLNAIAGEGVHILTVNDYLCERDFEEMRGVFEYAGLTVGIVLNNTPPNERKEAYACDITYTTNTEVGFDYLRDNTVLNREDEVLSELNYVIIDELDSVLIDDAKTPLILAVPINVDNKLYSYVNSKISQLKNEDVDYNLKEKYAILTDEGIKHIEELLNMKNFSWEENSVVRHVIIQCLKAQYLFKKDREYIVENGEIVLIDGSTGRIAQGRKLSDGLHQAIEVKEGVEITTDTVTTASITYQNFFKLYKKVSGMSGTIATEATEMKEFYELDVVVIPTNKPIIRKDEDDIVCKDKQEKYKMIMHDVIRSSRKGIPVLVGTINIKESEELSQVFRKYGINHKLLNAKTKKEEADIIGRAGKPKSITIATNMAGRGTDIKISEEVDMLGGLRVISTQRNLARRIDNQLIGRSGRQGNNGSSIFYLSPEDELFIEYSSKEVLKKAEKLNVLSLLDYVKKSIYKAQKMSEVSAYENRKNILKKDYIINLQREIVYKQRKEVINDEHNMGLLLARMIFEEIVEIVNIYININKINKKINETFNVNFNSEEIKNNSNQEDIINYYSEKVVLVYNQISTQINYDINPQLKKLFLIVLDKEWITHSERMEWLNIHSTHQSFVQKDPFLYYRNESLKLFDKMIIERRKSYLFKIFYELLINIKL